jgi:hypothetical protein
MDRTLTYPALLLHPPCKQGVAALPQFLRDNRLNRQPDPFGFRLELDVSFLGLAGVVSPPESLRCRIRDQPLDRLERKKLALPRAVAALVQDRDNCLNPPVLSKKFVDQPPGRGSLRIDDHLVVLEFVAKRCL